MMSDRGVLLLYCKKNLRAARQEEEEKEEKSENLANDEVFTIAAYFNRFPTIPPARWMDCLTPQE